MGRNAGAGFGILIAYVLPGFTVLASLSLVVPPLQIWLLGPAGDSPAVGGVLYVTAGSILVGQLLNLLRWAVLDRIYERTGLRRPVWDEQLLQERMQAFEMILNSHYRYHQFYGNLAIAVPVCVLSFRLSDIGMLLPLGVAEVLAVSTMAFLIAGSRDALQNYYRRTERLLAIK